MTLSISELSTILQLAASSPNEAKALIKLLSIDVVKALGENRYLIQTASKDLTAHSEQKLQEGSRYWAELTAKQNSTPTLSKLIQHPAIMKELQQLPVMFDLKELHKILSHEKPLESIKTKLLEHLSHASSKEDFTQISNLLLSFMNNTLTIPLQYQQYFGLFQMKKRYNKTTKRSQLDFYAALHDLGPISGSVMLIQNDISVNLSVVFKTTKLFLEENLNDIRYKTTIRLQEDIQPLYNLQTNKILDISA
jgi:hypothetical protein